MWGCLRSFGHEQEDQLAQMLPVDFAVDKTAERAVRIAEHRCTHHIRGLKSLKPWRFGFSTGRKGWETLALSSHGQGPVVINGLI